MELIADATFQETSLTAAIAGVLTALITVGLPQLPKALKYLRDGRQSQVAEVKETYAQTILDLKAAVVELKAHNKTQDAEMQALEEKHASCEKEQAAAKVAEFYMKRDITALESQVAKLQAWKEQHGGSDAVKNV